MNPPASSTLTIHRQRVPCHIGVTPEERAQSQTLEISVTFPIPDCEQTALSDDLSNSVNYHEVSRLIHTITGERPRQLIETLAADLARQLTDSFHLPYINIEIRKFILPETEAVVLNFKSQHPRPIP